MNNELLEILLQLEKNANDILSENERLKKEIEELKKNNSEEPIEPEKPNVDKPIEKPEAPVIGSELLGNLEDIEFTASASTFEIKDNQLIVEGKTRYASIFFTYLEKEEDCIPNVQGKYNLHLEGYKELGCTNSYINSTDISIVDNKFVVDTVVKATWQRRLKVTIFLNGSNAETSKIVITSLKLTKVE